MSETDENIEEDPDYEVSSSDENEFPAVDPPLNHQQIHCLPKMEGCHGPAPDLVTVLLMSSKWFHILGWPIRFQGWPVPP